MNIFPVDNTSGRVKFLTRAVAAADPFLAGVRLDAAGGGVLAATAGGHTSNAGFPVTDAGQIVYVDATAGLPANTAFVNGIPVSPAGAVCISTGAIQAYISGVPVVANGSIAATVV